MMKKLLVLPLALASLVHAEEARVTALDTVAAVSAGGDSATASFRLWVYEPERDSVRRRMFLAAVRRWMRDDAADNAFFRERAWPFVVDNERGRRFRLRINGTEIPVGPSRPDGWIRAEVTFPLVAKSTHDTLPYDVLDAAGRPVAHAVVHRAGPDGLTVVSDIDDTVKISSVTVPGVLLHNTFFEAWRPVPGMASRFQAWARQGAAFHFVSGSPVPLVVPLRAFLEDNGFPGGSLHLKPFRWRGGELRGLFDEADVHKTAEIEALLARFPRRRFILVGDTGERDPEIYAALARRHPGRIERILLRPVSPRRRRDDLISIYQGLNDELWTMIPEEGA